MRPYDWAQLLASQTLRLGLNNHKSTKSNNAQREACNQFSLKACCGCAVAWKFKDRKRYEFGQDREEGKDKRKIKEEKGKQTKIDGGQRTQTFGKEHKAQ